MRKNKNHKEIQHQTTELNRENGHKRGQRERGRSTPEMKRHVARQVSFESDNNAKLKQADEASEWWKGMTGENTWGKRGRGQMWLLKSLQNVHLKLSRASPSHRLYLSPKE